MLILAFDTTSEAGGAAIFRDQECLASAANQGPSHIYSITLFRMVDRLIAELSARPNSPLQSLANVELFAVANGPGSFTGIRVGLAAAQAWAKAFGQAVKGVSVLEALVEAGRPETEFAVPILDAQRGEFYLSISRRMGSSRFSPASEGLVLKPEALKTLISERLRAGNDMTCLVRAHDRAALALQATLPDHLRWLHVEGTLLQAIARAGYRAALEGKLDPPNRLDAYYIRRSDAELNWRD